MKPALPKEFTSSVDKLTEELNQNQKSLITSTKSGAACSIKGVLRSYKAKKRGVYVRVTINREHEYYPTGYYIDEKNFDIASGFVKGNEEKKETINSYARYLINELDGVLTTLKKSGDVISTENFQKHYSKRIKKDLSFEDYFKIALEEKKLSVESTTIEVYSRLITKINEYKPGISIRSIDKKFITDWINWLKVEKKLCQNTVNHYLQVLRTFLIKAKDDEVINVSPFAKIKISHVDGERDYLAQEELDALMRLQIPDSLPGEKRARDMFVFCCITGIRYSDLINLKWSNIRSITSDIYFQMHKTKFFVTIPLLDHAKEILEKQERDGEFVFKRITNQKLNEHLHALEKRAGIQKSITVHVARHTFATLSLERGVPLEVVSKILGHRNLKTTMIYAKITTKTLQTEMKKLNGMFNSMVQAENMPPTDMNNLLVQMHGIMQQMQQAQTQVKETTALGEKALIG
ncbi:MAG: site-specific integrase [Bacteroidetes bacterium]|nr:site-specific integrase [Bacteroidota bacterium]